ncbi:TAT-variant-translocated molybdopterin oxidoreductase [Flavobacteriaceae bacterium Ap0902]|nr:TAT-variant-translocated molybdopterin oxidoreductase [Flavobacteriaceae bacterium Ap0902]
MASKKRYWRSIEELQNQSLTAELAENEFAEELPVEGFLENKEALESSKTSRRDFLKYLGFSTAAATLAACEAPVVKSVPYVVKPNEVTPGVPTYYATAMYDGYDYANVIVKTREGRPIKIEPNKNSGSLGLTNARVQASVLSLYDSNRLKNPKINGQDSSWEQVDAVVVKQLSSLGGKKAVLLTPSLPSPSTKNLIREFQSKFGNVDHVVFDAVDYSPALDAAEESFGVRALPAYDISNTDLVISFNADFLNDWNGVSMEREYAAARKPGNSMLRHIQVESNLSMTGANADTRFPLKPSKVYQTLADVYSAVTGGSASTPEGKVLAEELRSKGSNAVVFADGNKEAYILANAINAAINSSALTGKLNLLKESNITRYKTFLNEAKNGSVGALFIYDSDPVAHSAYGEDLLEALKGIPLSVALNSYNNETSKNVNVIAPVPHWLECWGDFNPVSGEYALQQPTIQQIFNTRQLQDSLITWNSADIGNINNMNNSNGNDSIAIAAMVTPAAANAVVLDSAQAAVSAVAASMQIGDENSYYNYLKRYWNNNVQSGKSFNQALYDGVISGANAMDGGVNFIGTGAAGAASTLRDATESNWELQLYTKVGMGDGRQANNPWLQEFPDPITRTSWDNYLTMNPVDAEELGIDMWNGGNEKNGRMQFNGPYYNLTVEGKSLKVPVFIQPGQARGSLGLALGYGIDGKIAEANDLEQIGVNAYPIFKDGIKTWNIESLEAAGGSHEFANIQMMNTLMGRYEIAREVSLDDYINKPADVWNEQPTMDTFAAENTPVEEVTLWRNFDRSVGPHFKLSIDLNSCTGCGACVIACHAENNVPVVGKEEVRRSRDMHWLRIDRYYADAMSEEHPERYPYTQKQALMDEEYNEPSQYKILVKPAAENPDVIFQPMMCQHCNHAPCETVCPVAATSHGKQGQNQMAYNRCVGTRYCANNCPYKVRRFNWFNYAQNDSFDFHMNNDLGRMVLNPDVVVRQRGVMEKCSMCIQMTQAAILEAKKGGRRVADDEFQTACSNACPTGSMVFGDINDEESQVAKLESDNRKYEVLEDVGTKPNVFYHVKVRNRDNN